MWGGLWTVRCDRTCAVSTQGPHYLMLFDNDKLTRSLMIIIPLMVFYLVAKPHLSLFEESENVMNNLLSSFVDP